MYSWFKLYYDLFLTTLFVEYYFNVIVFNCYNLKLITYLLAILIFFFQLNLNFSFELNYSISINLDTILTVHKINLNVYKHYKIKCLGGFYIYPLQIATN